MNVKTRWNCLSPSSSSAINIDTDATISLFCGYFVLVPSGDIESIPPSPCLFFALFTPFDLGINYRKKYQHAWERNHSMERDINHKIAYMWKIAFRTVCQQTFIRAKARRKNDVNKRKNRNIGVDLHVMQTTCAHNRSRLMAIYLLAST